MKAKRRIVFYSHDTFGLGHIRRTQKLANEIASEDTSILIICASPKASAYSSSQGIEYLNLPGFTKQITGEYIPRSLNIPIDEFVNLRASLILSAVRAYQPDYFIIDKEPLGVKRELIPALEYLKSNRKSCDIICGFRDILDEPTAVADEWRKRDTEYSLQQYFDHIFIYGEKSIYDFAKEYSLSETVARKLIYLGYVHPEENHNKSFFEFPFQNNLPTITLTVGGGGDGDDILNLYSSLLQKRSRDLNFNTFILTGPFAQPTVVQQLRESALGASDKVHIENFVSDSFSVFSQSHLVVSMGGYNTMTELVSMGKKTLILPRVKPRKEQLIRAQVFKAHELCDYISPEELTEDSLLEKIKQALRAAPTPSSFKARGLGQFKEFFRGAK